MSVIVGGPGGLKGHYAFFFWNICIFQVFHEYLNEHRPTLSPAQKHVSNSSFLQYKFCVDGILMRIPSRRGVKRTVGLSKIAISSTPTYYFLKYLQVRPTIVTFCLQWMMSASFTPETYAVSRRFLASVQLSCCWMLTLWHAHEQTSVRDSHG